jgi:hypothetical protein
MPRESGIAGGRVIGRTRFQRLDTVSREERVAQASNEWMKFLGHSTLIFGRRGLSGAVHMDISVLNGHHGVLL